MNDLFQKFDELVTKLEEMGLLKPGATFEEFELALARAEVEAL